MAARRAAGLVDPAHRLARCGEHDLPLPARKPLEAHRVARRGRGCRRLARLAGRRPADRAPRRPLTGPLPQDEFDWIFSRVPRLTVEVVIASSDRGVLLALRDFGPCKGLWHLPGGTVRFGEPVTEAVRRVARDELGLDRERRGAARLHRIPQPLQQRARFTGRPGVPRAPTRSPRCLDERDLRSECAWFTTLPENMHDEQREFLARHLGIVARRQVPSGERPA